MFDIEYKGGNGIIITTKKTTAVVDPKISVVGLKDLPTKNMVEIATEKRFGIQDPNVRIYIEGPGEYEVGDLSIKGTAVTRHIDTDSDEPISTIYRVEIGEARLAIIGNITPKLSDDQLEAIGVIDILIIPVGGGGYTLDASHAAALTRLIDPKVVIPIHYAEEGITYEVPQDTLEVFIKDLGAPVETTAKYKVKGVSTIPQVLTILELTRS